MYFKEGYSSIKSQDGFTTALLVVGIIVLIVMGVFPGILPSFLATPMW